MLKVIFEIFIDKFLLLDNPVHNYIIMAIVGFAVYMISYDVVGRLYSERLIEGRIIGHIVHWIIRFIVFLLIYFALYVVISIYRLIMKIPIDRLSLIVWIIIVSVIASIIKVKILREEL